MIELLKFVLRDVATFGGTVVLLVIVGGIAIELAKAMRGKV